MRILFMGNHTVGIQALETILEQDEVVGVVTHPADPQESAGSPSLYEYACKKSLNVVRMKGRDAGLEDFIRSNQPDLLWITDYRYLLSSTLLTIAPMGAVNLHPSLLPKYRGRAPINWAIINGERKLGLTAHFVDRGIDSGDIIEQIEYGLTEDQDVGDALQILYPLYKQITRKVLVYFRSGQVPRRLQDHSQATVFPRRRPEDGLIDWYQPAERVRDFIRALTRPYPGAFSFYKGAKIMIWSAALFLEKTDQGVPGQVLCCESNRAVVRTGQGTILIGQAELADSGEPFAPSVGEIMEES